MHLRTPLVKCFACIALSSTVLFFSCGRKEVEPPVTQVPKRTSTPATSVTSLPARTPNYRIARKEDLSYGRVTRFQYRIALDQSPAEADLRAICEGLIAQQKQLKPCNAISFAFYLPGSDVNGHYTAGKADWAPNGKWEDASSVRAGDYSRHQLSIKLGSALGKVPKSVETDLPESQKRRIFYDLVAAQDRGVGDQRAYQIIANKYGVKDSTVRKIAVEGVMKGWPMP